MTGRFNLPLVLDGAAIEALVVGAGAVATRKVLALVAGGATVRVRAPRISDELTRRATADDRILIEPAVYDDEAIGDAMLVLAATDDRAVNARIADDARRARRLVLVADDADAGSFTMPAVHRCGELLVSVTSGGVPGVSTRVRGAIARRFDDRYAAAIRDLSRLRARLLADDDRAVNARIAADARRARRLVRVADDADAGSFTMPAVHRCGELLVAVTSGGVPGVSTRVRGEIARRFDDRYAAAIRDLSRLRARLLADDDRAAWRAAATALLADDFCDAVESGTFRERLAAWL